MDPDRLTLARKGKFITTEHDICFDAADFIRCGNPTNWPLRPPKPATHSKNYAENQTDLSKSTTDKT